MISQCESLREAVYGERSESCSPLGCMELRCHGHSADNWAHSSSCRPNTIKPNIKHLEKLHRAFDLISLHIATVTVWASEIGAMFILMRAVMRATVSTSCFFPFF